MLRFLLIYRLIITFCRPKERAGIERALVNGAFSSGQVSAEVFQRIIRIISEQTLFFDLFKVYATPQQQSLFSQTEQSAVFGQVQQYRNYIYLITLDSQPEYYT